MKLKTFIATYLLFLLILFSSVGIVSVYLTNSQIEMLQNKAAGQYQAITSTLIRDIMVVQGRTAARPEEFFPTVAELVRSYARYYNRHGVHLWITTSAEYNAAEISFAGAGGNYTIYISGTLPIPFQHWHLDYSLDITQNILEMRAIQNALLISIAIFSIIAAFALYFILSSIFKPLNVIAKTSREIASGQFGERISIKGKNELAQVAYDFNKMAQRIESQIQHLEEEAENKQQFVDNFAHEIRTPLTSIYGYAEYMQKAALDTKEIIESSAYIMDEASHMKNIANSLLELATLRNYVPVKKPLPIQKLFEDVAQSMQKPLQESGMQLFHQAEEGNILAQEDLIKSLLINLCNNAIKSGSPSIGLKATKHEDGIKISVADNGRGIPEEALPKILQPFYRMDKSRNRQQSGGGIGLGLALCNRIAQAHGAKMQIKSAIGKGTTVELTFTTS
ncbi:MAG: HAMP domain-containing histidine kinase [Defluviitaleaceae bacterium]|nr:HAMP domain-containing histidine kinase [Defluviitaleaceae bacterium]